MFIFGYGHIAKIGFNGRHPNIARSHCPTVPGLVFCQRIDGLCDQGTADIGRGQKYVIDKDGGSVSVV